MKKNFRGVKVIACVVGLIIVLLTGSLRGAVSIRPAFIDIELDKGRPAGSLVISNPGDAQERFRVRVIHFELLRDGGLREVKPDDKSLATQIKFNPRELTLAPKTRRTIRFVILSRGKRKDGEYWAGLELESLKTTVSKTKDGGGRDLKIEVVSSILVPIFGKSGKVNVQGSLDGATLKSGKNGPQLTCSIVNKGNGRFLVRGKYEILSEKGESLEKGDLGYSYVLRESARNFKTDVKAKLPEGNYRVKINYTSPQLKAGLSEEFTLAYKPAAPPETEPTAKTKPTITSPEKGKTKPPEDQPDDKGKGNTSDEPLATDRAPASAKKGQVQ